MANQPSASRYLMTTLAIILVITAFILVALNAFQIQTNPFRIMVKKTAEHGYVDGYLAARKNYQAICPLAGQPTNFFTGVVQSVSGQNVVVVEQSLETDPLVDHISNTRTVAVDANTIIQSSVTKSADEIAQDLKALQDSLKKGGVVPAPSNSVSATLSDIAPGQSVYIQSDQDVRLLSTIPAKIIRLLK
jgi:hypothetical protein